MNAIGKLAFSVSMKANLTCSLWRRRPLLFLGSPALHQSSHCRYGSPRVQAELKARGHHHSRKRIPRLMRLQGLRARPTRQFTHTTQSNHGFPVAQNILARRFQSEAPNMVWVSDIT